LTKRELQLVSRYVIFKIHSSKASTGWVQDCKKKHKIRQRHGKYINSKDIPTLKEGVKAAELFTKQTATINPNHSFYYLM
jgi:hypothetical protein